MCVAECLRGERRDATKGRSGDRGALSDAITWQKRTSLSVNASDSRSVRRKIAPMTDERQRIGTTTIERTLRTSSAARAFCSIGSLGASGMNTVSPDSNARLSSG